MPDHGEVRFWSHHVLMVLSIPWALAFTANCQAGGGEETAEKLKQAEEQVAQAEKEIADLKAKAEALPATAPLAAPSPPITGATTAEPTSSAVPQASAPATAPGVYALSVINAIADNCRSPSIMLSTVPNTVAEKDDFVWAFATQAVYAHPAFKPLPRARLSQKGHVAFEDVKLSERATALIAYCHDGPTCNELAAMYKTTVPSSKPEVYCGKTWNPGQQSRGLGNAADLAATARSKLQDSAAAMCARIGVCTKQRDPSSAGDPGVECQKAPTQFKYKCAQKDSCADVLACTAQ